MKERTMARKDWTRITGRRYLAQNYEMNGIPGRISLLQIDAVAAPLFVDHLGRRVKIADKGYSWLQIALHGEYFWFTAMFDENDRFRQIYVDMTGGNIANVEDARFVDMYLDFVVWESHIEQLDMDELEEAFAQGQITGEQFHKTLEEGKRIRAWLERDRDALIALVTREQKRMKALSEACRDGG